MPRDSLPFRLVFTAPRWLWLLGLALVLCWLTR